MLSKEETLEKINISLPSYAAEKISYASDSKFQEKEEILNKAEKEYLSGVIRPFRDEVKGIIKEKLDDKNWISIDFKDDICMDFPNLKKKDDYKGMEVGKLYSLEELGL